jgi:hypothetical protein
VVTETPLEPAFPTKREPDVTYTQRMYLLMRARLSGMEWPDIWHWTESWVDWPVPIDTTEERTYREWVELDTRARRA